MFAYCNNNPAICSDPNGQSCLSYTCAFTPPDETCGFGGFCCGDSSFSCKALLKTTGKVASNTWSWTKGAAKDTWRWITNEERIMGVVEIIGGICTIFGGVGAALSPEPVSKPVVVGVIIGGASLVWAGIKKVFSPELR